jgi:hypothetical protein
VTTICIIMARCAAVGAYCYLSLELPPVQVWRTAAGPLLTVILLLGSNCPLT